MTTTLIRGGHLVTMNSEREHFFGDLRIQGEKIVEIGRSLGPKPGEHIVSAENCFVIPGLIQTHTHLCQTLFRGMADDLELLDWLKMRIWPFEAAHTRDSLRHSARLGLLEMQLLGTTSILDMGTVRDHDVIFEEARASGMRYWGGPCFMDRKDSSGPLHRDLKSSLNEAESLIREWHDPNSLVQFAMSPRFAISCSDKMLRSAAEMAQDKDLIFHTHASENKSEVNLVKKRTGLDNVKYLKKVGALGEKTVIAHGVHLSKSELGDLILHRCGLSHCPSSNLKLASGIANLARYLELGLKVGLGADGAPCNNMMDPFMEMRLAALLQKPLNGPTSIPAIMALELATIGGAEVLNLEAKIGSLETGKLADVVIVSRNHPSVATVTDPYSALVYSCSGRDVLHVWTNGRRIVDRGQHMLIDGSETIAKSKESMKAFLI